MIEGGFRPKSLGLYRPKIHVITFTFFTFFYVFFENQKNVTFYVFCCASHVFSNYAPTPYRVDGCIISIRHSCTYLLNYTVILLGGYKTGNISETVEDRAKLLTVYIKSYTGFRLPPKCMTLNDLCARFKVIYSLNAAKMAKYSLVMTPTPCRVFCLW